MDHKPARLLCPWDPPGKNPGVGCQGIPPPGNPTSRGPHLQGIPPPGDPSSRGSSQPYVSYCLLHCQVGSLPLAPPGKPAFIRCYVAHLCYFQGYKEVFVTFLTLKVLEILLIQYIYDVKVFENNIKLCELKTKFHSVHKYKNKTDYYFPLFFNDLFIY